MTNLCLPGFFRKPGKGLTALLIVLLLPWAAWAAGELPGTSGPRPVVQATALMQHLNQGSPLFLVDIRPEDQFQSCRIPGSLNIPLTLVKTRSFLRSAPVVLIHPGHTSGPVEAEALNLRSQGFVAVVLDGGLLAWRSRGGALVGDPFAVEALNRIDCQDLIVNFNSPDIALVAVVTTPPSFLVEAFPLNSTASEHDLDAALGNLFSGRSASLRAVVLNQAGQGCDRLESLVRPDFQDRVFFLSGGLEAFERLQNDRTLALQPLSQRKLSTGKCQTCNAGPVPQP